MLVFQKNQRSALDPKVFLGQETRMRMLTLTVANLPLLFVLKTWPSESFGAGWAKGQRCG